MIPLLIVAGARTRAPIGERTPPRTSPRMSPRTSPRDSAPSRAGLKCVVQAILLVGIFTPLTLTAQAAGLSSATIEDLNAAFDTGTLTSQRLVEMYLARIAAYDQSGPALNALLTLNSEAIETARALDAERRERGPRSPLHGIPVVLKDNVDTADMPTTAGSLILAGSIPPDDAFIVQKLRAAGAIILAKANMSEFASGVTMSSVGGRIRNPHDLARTPSGSSGGTGAAIAASFAQLGIGTDTGGSVRGPSTSNGIVGLKPTHGLMSRDGIVPLALSFDMAGPMARSVYDVAAMLGVMTGVDPADDATIKSRGGWSRITRASWTVTRSRGPAWESQHNSSGRIRRSIGSSMRRSTPCDARVRPS